MDGYNEAMQECVGNVTDSFLDGITEILKELKNEPNYETIKSKFEKRFGFEWGK